MKYFEGLTNLEDAKSAYKILAKKHHPDIGGCTETMKEINCQYEKILEGIFQKEGKSITEIEELLKDNLVLREKLNEIIMIEGIQIEICHKWIWLTGDTYSSKDKIKSSGFFWSKNKQAWYWRAEASKCYSKKNWSIDEIRTRYGSVEVKTERRSAIA
jgi:hypothetical protein